MRKFAFSLIFLLSAHTAHADERIGFKEITVPDESRPLHVALWYPTTDAGPEATVAENPVFQGVSALKDARASGGPHPLVVLSHGYGGSWRNLSWLATELAHKGYVVAAPDHPGTTTFDRDPQKAKKLWGRPRDLSHVIDDLVAERSLNIDNKRIAAIGHSLGGWTVTELAGGRFDAALVMQNCAARFGQVACKLFSELGIGENDAATARLGSDLSDARIGAVVTLDLGPARGFTPESLVNVRVPFLIIAAGADIAKTDATRAEVAATNQDSHYLALHLPAATTNSTRIADALHFSFMQVCKPGAVDLIEEETPGEGIVCKDGGSRDREAIHRETADMIIVFLAKALPAK